MSSVILRVLGEERVSTYREPEDWFTEALTLAAAGEEPVNEKTAKTYAAVWRAISLISGDVAKLPLFVYEREGEQGKRRAKNHPAYRLLRYKANPNVSAFQFKRALTHPGVARGNGYAYIERRGDGLPLALWEMKHDSTWPVLENGLLYYVTRLGGEEIRIPASNIFHIRGLGDSIEGLSVIQYARESLGVGISAMKFGRRFFANGASVGGTLTHPGKLGDKAEKNLRQWLAEHHEGLDRAHKLMLLEEGMKYEKISIPPEEAQFLQTREFEIREVANWYGVPPHKLGDETRTSYASLEQENQSYLDEGLDHWLCTWEAEAHLKLLSAREQEQDTHVVEFLRQALVRANMTTRSAYYHMALQDGWMSRDEIRSLENMNAIPGGQGEEFLEPLNMVPIGSRPPAKAPVDDEAARQLLTETVQRIYRRLQVHAAKARKAGQLSEWLSKRMVDEHLSIIMAILEPVLPMVAPHWSAEACGRFLCAEFRSADGDGEALCPQLVDEILHELALPAGEKAHATA